MFALDERKRYLKDIVIFVYNYSMLDYLTEKQFPYLKNNFNIFVLHISKLTQDRSKQNLSQQIKSTNTEYILVDISHYSLRRLILLMKKINPEFYMSYTYNSSYDYLLFYIAKHNNICTIFHDHGLVFGSPLTNKVPIVSTINLYKIKRFLAFNFKLAYLSFRLKKVEIIVNFYKVKDPSVKYPNFDKYLFYSFKNVEFYSSFFKLQDNNYLVGGVPNFIDRNQFRKLSKIQPEKQILYLHQPFRKFGFSNIKKSDEIKYYKKLSDIALTNGYKFIIRLHPTQKPVDYDELMNIKNIDFDINNQLQYSIAVSEIIIGHWSTALATGLSLGKPTLILNFPEIKKRFNNYYHLFGDICLRINNLSDLSKAIRDINTNKEWKYDANRIKYLIGENNTYENNVQLLLKLIEKW